MGRNKLFNKESMKAYALLTQIGINMFTYLIVGVLIGNFIDNKLGTSPIFLMIFMISGIIGGFRSVYRLIIGDETKNGKEN